MSFFHFAKLIVIDKDENVLVLRRSSTHPFRAFKPDIPGGNIEKGETKVEAVIRELFEETGMKVSSNQIVNPHEDFKQKFGSKIVEHNVFLLHLNESKPKVTLSWEHDQYEWLPFDQLNDLEGNIQHSIDDIRARELWKKI